MIYIFFGWFITLIFFLPVSIGCWLVYWGLISTEKMWAISLILSIVIAINITLGDIKDHPKE